MSLVLEETHLRTLVDGGVDAGCPVAFVHVFRRRRRPRISRHGIDPPAMCKGVVRVHVVRFPESACVGGHGVAADRPGCGRSTA